MMYSLPFTVIIDGEEYAIRNKCDFRIVLDVIDALNDNDLSQEERLQCALFIFYGDETKRINNVEEAIRQMFVVINLGEEEQEQKERPRVMDWRHDFPVLAPPISRTLGYDVRTPDKYTHWWTFVGAYMEIGECTFSNVVSIRKKRMKGIKLEKWEEEFCKENKQLVDLPHKLSQEEQDFLDSDW